MENPIIRVRDWFVATFTGSPEALRRHYAHQCKKGKHTDVVIFWFDRGIGGESRKCIHCNRLVVREDH